MAERGQTRSFLVTFQFKKPNGISARKTTESDLKNACETKSSACAIYQTKIPWKVGRTAPALTG